MRGDERSEYAEGSQAEPLLGGHFKYIHTPLGGEGIADVAGCLPLHVLGYKGKWGPLAQPRCLGDGPRIMVAP